MKSFALLINVQSFRVSISASSVHMTLLHLDFINHKHSVDSNKDHILIYRLNCLVTP